METELERAAAVKSARQSQVLSGGDVSGVALALSEAYIAGTVTTAEMLCRVLSEYGHSSERNTVQIPEI